MVAPPLLGRGSGVAGSSAAGCLAGDGPDPGAVGGTAVGWALGGAAGCCVGPGMTGAARGGEVGAALGLGVWLEADLLLTTVPTVVPELGDGPPVQDAAGRPVTASAPVVAPIAIVKRKTVATTGIAQAGRCRERPGTAGRGCFGKVAAGRPRFPCGAGGKDLAWRLRARTLSWGTRRMIAGSSKACRTPDPVRRSMCA